MRVGAEGRSKVIAIESVQKIYTKQKPPFHPIIGEMSEPGLWSYVKDFKSSSVVVRRVGSNPTLVKREYSITPPNQPDSFLHFARRGFFLR